MNLLENIANPRRWISPWHNKFALFSLACLILGFCALNIDFVLAQPDTLAELPGDLKRVFDLSEIFAHGFGILLIVVGIWILVPNKRRFLPRLISCAVLPSLTVQLVKLLVGRKRPTAFLQLDGSVRFPDNIFDTWVGWLPQQELNVKYISQSFPSAHTATVLGLAIGLSWIFPRGKWLFFSIAILASSQRITSLAHWSSDVFFGAAVAFLIAGAFIQQSGWGCLFDRFEQRKVAKPALDTPEEPSEKSRAA